MKTSMPKGSAALSLWESMMIRTSQAFIDSLLESDWQLHDPTTEGMGIGDEPALLTAWPVMAISSRWERRFFVWQVAQKLYMLSIKKHSV